MSSALKEPWSLELKREEQKYITGEIDLEGYNQKKDQIWVRAAKSNGVESAANITEDKQLNQFSRLNSLRDLLQSLFMKDRQQYYQRHLRKEDLVRVGINEQSVERHSTKMQDRDILRLEQTIADWSSLPMHEPQVLQEFENLKAQLEEKKRSRGQVNEESFSSI